jgi:hypothetical protein
VVFESGRYVFGGATLTGYGADVGDPDYDPHLHVWEAEQGISAPVAALVGLPQGRSSHLTLNNVRLKDNRIPPRGFTNAGYAAIDAEPVGAAFADGQHWDDVVYPVGPAATRAEVTLYYQTASREYVEFLRDQNTTTAAGDILFDLWDQHNKSEPVEMARLTVETDAALLAKCHANVAKSQAKYLKRVTKAWARCYDERAAGGPCDTVKRDARLAAATAELRARIGGIKDRACVGAILTPGSLGHGSTCPAPCGSLALFDLNDLATCGLCLSDALVDEALDAAYGTTPPALPTTVPAAALSCQKRLGKTASTLASKWSDALLRCEQDNARGENVPPLDCTLDPEGRIASAQAGAAEKVARCTDFTGIGGCATNGSAALVSSCIETAIGTAVGPSTQGAYP